MATPSETTANTTTEDAPTERLEAIKFDDEDDDVPGAASSNDVSGVFLKLRRARVTTARRVTLGRSSNHGSKSFAMTHPYDVPYKSTTERKKDSLTWLVSPLYTDCRRWLHE